MASSQITASSLAALVARFTQDTRLLRLTTPLGTALLAECVRGEEGISEGYRFRIEALSTDAKLELKSLIGQPVLLQLLTARSRDDLRPFHGHVLSAEQSGANGGFARYVLTMAPWTAFLGYGRDSRIFQDMDVFEILEAVFRPYQGQGRLVPAWRFEIVDRSVYPKRSLTTQYQESDLAFAERLMHEEGLFHFFEHASAPNAPALGSHTMVIADHNRAFKPNVQESIAFTKPGAVMKADSIDVWRSEVQLTASSVELTSWDYRSKQRRQVLAVDRSGDASLTSRDTPGAYAFHSRTHGERIADNQLEAMQARCARHVCAGTARTLAPGTTFKLNGHAVIDRAGSDEARSFLVVRVRHVMNNNLSADLLDGVAKLLGEGVVAGDEAASTVSAPYGAGDRPLYRNRADLVPASVSYRSDGVDAHGRVLHPRPTVRGQQTGIVVGPPGAVVHTDRDHRVKVQFHWQRGAASHSRLTHPAVDGHTGAPGDDTAGTWIRVIAPVAGPNWGGHSVPRVGQEVLVDFLDGDIDRPVVIGSLYNGRGKEDAQYNQINHGAGPGTGNAPAWFAGADGGHGHPAVLSGFKSQAMQSSQTGDGAYSQMVFDDSAGQSRVAVQVHAKAHDGAAELNLGYLRHQSDNRRLDPVGIGTELKTAHGAAVRAGHGLLLSSDGRNGGVGEQLDSGEAVEQIEQGFLLQREMGILAKKHNALLAGESERPELPAVADLDDTRRVVARLDLDASAGRGGERMSGYGAPLLQLSAPVGIAATTPANVILAAGTTSCACAGQDINLLTQANSALASNRGISLFTYGKARNTNKPNQETGISVHAASGKLRIQSQSGPTGVLADKTLTVASVMKSVAIAAPKKHVLLAAQGAYIKLEGGNIEVHAPGKIEFKASMKELAGPVKIRSSAEALKVHELDRKRDLELGFVDAEGKVLKGEDIALRFSDSTNRVVTLDSDGKATVRNAPLGPFGARQPTRR